MRIRTAKFVMIPMWVLSHDQVRGNSTRISVYAGLRAVAWESPDVDWRSIREIARAVSDVIGIGEEAVRKHLSVLQEIRAFVRVGDELLVPDDEPGLGTAVGTHVPNDGSGGTQTGDLTLFPKREGEENTPVGTTGARSKADLNQEHPDFARFWKAYPRKKDRPEAVRAFNKAIRAGWTIDDVLDGLGIELMGWRRSNRPMSKIPYPATWLNQQGWMNEPDRPDRGKATSTTERAAQSVDAQLAELERAIDDGRGDDAWAILLERAATTEYAWWRDAERIHTRTNSTIAATCNVPIEQVERWRAMRQGAMRGDWGIVSQGARELGS